MNTELMINLVEEKIEKLLNEVNELMDLKSEILNPVSNTPSQDYSFQLEESAAVIDSLNEDPRSRYYYDIGRNRSYEEMINDGYSMTDDGFYFKEKDTSTSGSVTFS